MTNMMETMRQKARHIMAGMLLVGAVAGTSQAALAASVAGKVDYKSTPACETTRASGSVTEGTLSVGLKTYRTVTTAGDQDAGGFITVGYGPIIGWARTTDDKKNAGLEVCVDDTLHAGPVEFTGVDAFPVFLQITPEGDVFGNSFYGRATATAGRISIDTCVDYELRNGNGGTDAKDSHAEYVTVRTDRIGLAAGRDYAGVPRLDLGFTAAGGDIGGLVDVKYDDADNFEASATIAQAPGKVTSPKGTTITQDVFTTGEFNETATYLTSTASKSTGGWALKVKVAEKDGVRTYTPEVGFNAGKFTATVGEDIPAEEKAPYGFVKLSFKEGPIFVETKLDNEGVDGVYVGLTY